MSDPSETDSETYVLPDIMVCYSKDEFDEHYGHLPHDAYMAIKNSIKAYTLETFCPDASRSPPKRARRLGLDPDGIPIKDDPRPWQDAERRLRAMVQPSNPLELAAEDLYIDLVNLNPFLYRLVCGTRSEGFWRNSGSKLLLRRKEPLMIPETPMQLQVRIEWACATSPDNLRKQR